MDALEFVDAVASCEVDVAYLDPPYNQHKYLGNYHIWETLILWDKPAVYGRACKRVDCRERTSVFNSKPQFTAAFAELVRRVKARWLVVSFSDEGYLDRTTAEAILGQRGQVRVVEHDYKRYVGAQIGIYNPSGEKVGAVSHLRNTEYVYVVGESELTERSRAYQGRRKPQQVTLFE